jgi:hypothetical protein
VGEIIVGEKIERYHSAHPLRFPILGDMAIEQVATYSEPARRLDMTIRLRSERGDQWLTLKFYGVQELVLRQPTLTEIRVSALELTSIRELHWENLKYKVRESEENIFSFYCSDFDVDMSS